MSVSQTDDRRAALKARERTLDTARLPGSYDTSPATEAEIEAEAVKACRAVARITFEERAARGDVAAALAILDRAPDVPPHEGYELPKAFPG